MNTSRPPGLYRGGKKINNSTKIGEFSFGKLLFYFLNLTMDGRNRADVKPGMLVNIILKKDQRTGNLTEGIVKDLLTSSAYHSRGIKVRLTDGQVGRVAEIIEDDF